MVTVGYNPSTGKALMGTGGALCIGCCGGSASPCTYCSGSTPYQVDVAFSGIAACACALSGGYDRVGRSETVSYVNNTFRLTQDTSCVWKYSATGLSVPFLDVFSSGSGCSGTPVAQYNMETFNITLTRSSSTATIQASLSFAGGLGYHILFSASYTPSAKCVEVLNQANANLCSVYRFYSGTATITEV